MFNKSLLPNNYKKVGWYMLITAAIFGVILTVTDFNLLPLRTKVFAIVNGEWFGQTDFFSFPEADVIHTIVGILFIVGALFVGFSKEKREDEFIANLRLSSLLWSVWLNYIVLIFAFLFVYGTAFFTFMVYNMFTVLVIFIARFNYILYKSTKTVSDEK